MNPSDQARQAVVVDSWLADFAVSGSAVNPGAGVVIADTGELPEGYYDLQILVSVLLATVWADPRIQHRDAANAVSLFEQWVALPATSTLFCDLNNRQVSAGERIRVVATNAITNSIFATIIGVKRA